MATRYGITTAVKVNGVSQRSIWADPAQGLAWIIDQSRLPHSYATRALASSGDAAEAIKWNFTKFLVDAEGNVVERYAPQTEPKELAGAIEKLL